MTMLVTYCEAASEDAFNVWTSDLREVVQKRLADQDASDNALWMCQHRGTRLYHGVEVPARSHTTPERPSWQWSK